MIICSIKKLEVNKIYSNKDFPNNYAMTDQESNPYYEYTFFVLREATIEDWNEHNSPSIPIYEYLYEISTD